MIVHRTTGGGFSTGRLARLRGLLEGYVDGGLVVAADDTMIQRAHAGDETLPRSLGFWTTVYQALN